MSKMEMHLYEEQVGLLELEIKFMPGQRTKKEQISACCGHTIECKATLLLSKHVCTAPGILAPMPISILTYGDLPNVQRWYMKQPHVQNTRSCYITS